MAGRRLPVYIAAASIMATWFAAATLMGGAATAYRSGFQGVIFGPFGAVLVSLAAMVAISRVAWRRDRPLPLTDVDGQPLPLRRRLGLLRPREIL